MRLIRIAVLSALGLFSIAAAAQDFRDKLGYDPSPAYPHGSRASGCA